MSTGTFVETSTIDRLYLELSQFTSATTAKELKLQGKLARYEKALREIAELDIYEHSEVSMSVKFAKCALGEDK